MKRGKLISWGCPRCGYSELILVLEDGRLERLREGMEVAILNTQDRQWEDPPERSSESSLSPDISHETVKDLIPWAPDFALKEKNLISKYGVWLPKDAFLTGLGPEVYSAAYLAKLKDLVSSWDSCPLPVLLDKYFAAGYLASGKEEEILISLWQELEEIRRPILEVVAYMGPGPRWEVKGLSEEQASLVASTLKGLDLDTFFGLL